jgi:hypothetical protein
MHGVIMLIIFMLSIVMLGAFNQCLNTECLMLIIVKLSAIMLCVVMLSVVMLCVIMLSAVIFSVVILSVIMSLYRVAQR